MKHRYIVLIMTEPFVDTETDRTRPDGLPKP
jgi:hypothetical protein